MAPDAARAVVQCHTDIGGAAPASAARAQELRIAVEGEYPPFNQTDKKGKLSGFDVDIAKALCKALDASCELVKQRWDRMIPDLVDGKYDLVVSSMSITAERRQKIDFTNPYYQTPAKFVAKKNADLPATLDALKGRRIGVQKATTHEQYLMRQLGSSAEIVRFQTLPKAQAELTAGKVDVVFGDALALVGGLPEDRQGQGATFSSAPTWSSAAASESACARASPTWWPTSTGRWRRSAPTGPTTRSLASTSHSRCPASPRSRRCRMARTGAGALGRSRP